MLVLTRKTNQTIEIGGGIVLHVLRIGADNVRIGIAAPRSVAVHRGEIAAGIRNALETGTLSELRDQMDAEENR